MEDSTATKQILVDLLETCRKENKRLRKEDKRIRKKERRHRKKCKHQRKEIRRLREATMHRIDKIAKQIAPENPVLSQSANDLGSNKRARITTESSDEEPPVKVAKGITAAALSKLAIDGTKTGYINEKSIATKSTGTLCSESDDGLEQTEKTESEYSEYHDNDSKNTKSDGQFRWLPSMVKVSSTSFVLLYASIHDNLLIATGCPLEDGCTEVQGTGLGEDSGVRGRRAHCVTMSETMEHLCQSGTRMQAW